eukprot:756214-Hanusia_phi.AAC.4
MAACLQLGLDCGWSCIPHPLKVLRLLPCCPLVLLANATRPSCPHLSPTLPSGSCGVPDMVA